MSRYDSWVLCAAFLTGCTFPVSPTTPGPKSTLSPVGTWSQDSILSCGDTVVAVTENERIRELVFKTDSTFTVTWLPFESYYDYWGRYVADSEKNELRLTVTSGNHVPPDIRASGTYGIDDRGRLILRGIWLGTRTDPSRRGCGAIFKRGSN